MTKFVLRFDDVTAGMAWTRFLPFKKYLERKGIRSILGVVPECQDPNLLVESEREDYLDLLRSYKRHGDAIAQHGTFHLYDSKESGILGINAASEFAGHSYECQVKKLEYGKKVLLDHDLWQPYFMAPSHSFDKNTLMALSECGFEAVTDGYGFYTYKDMGIDCIPSLTSFPIKSGFGVCTICLHINTCSSEKVRRITAFIDSNRENFITIEQAREIRAPSILIEKSLQCGTGVLLNVARRRRRRNP